MTKHDIVPTHLAVTAMRDNGYKNAAYAIAELMDNAIQADATNVELLCGDKTELRRQRRTSQIHTIAVLDNGRGMSANVLRMALQFGNGMYLDPNDHTGIGRFGMGLPSSSISQARRVDVWTWQNGPEDAMHSYLDLDEILSGQIDEVPEPSHKPIPEMWRRVGQSYEDSGTLVVWSDIDKSIWQRSSTIIKNSEFVIGRIYRRFLADGRVKIRFVTFDVSKPDNIERNDFAKPNDPIYLMGNTSQPSHPDPVVPGEDVFIQPGEPMFTIWGAQEVFRIKFRGDIHEMSIHYSIAKNAARKGASPGALKHGKHAARNVGVSIMRADRELDLDPAWSDPSDPRDRWWGVEIDFPPALDDLFGVTNNKQSARYFSDLAKVRLEDLIEDSQTLGSARDIYEADEDPQWPLYEIVHSIRKNINSMQDYVRQQKEGTRRRSSDKSNDNTDIDSPQAIATQITKQRQEKGHSGQSDRQEDLSEEEKIEDIQQVLMEQGAESEEEAKELAAEIVERGYKYEFRSASLATSPAFFDVQSRGGKILITLNMRHPAYERLIEVLEEDVEGVSEAELRARLIRASDGLDLLLSAWARYEDEQPDGPLKEQVQEARWDWGRMARDFLREDN
jgi:hypothetical protein